MRIDLKKILKTSALISIGLHVGLVANANPSVTLEAYQSGVIAIDKGNYIDNMPEMPKGTLDLLKSQYNLIFGGKSEDEKLHDLRARYSKTVSKLLSKYETSHFSLKNEAVRAGKMYDVDPAHILAAIVGEHLFNVGVTDSIQALYINSKKWEQSTPEQNDFVKLKTCPEMRKCQGLANDYDTIECYDQTWFNEFRGRRACGQGERFPNKRFIDNFFNPNSIGTTYGLGQLGPVKALSLSDMVSQISGYPRITLENQKAAYKAVLDPVKTVHYIAAATKKNISLYKEYAHFDISKNIGLTATLYNLGQEKERAKKLYKANVSNLRRGKALTYPQVNYYGWFMNEIESQLRADYGL